MGNKEISTRTDFTLNRIPNRITLNQRLMNIVKVPNIKLKPLNKKSGIIYLITSVCIVYYYSLWFSIKLIQPETELYRMLCMLIAGALTSGLMYVSVSSIKALRDDMR